MENIAHVIELWTKIPASKIREEEFQRLSQLEERLKSHIVGQDEAIAAVSAAVRRNRVGISPKHKPVSFIFVGSTGVGKTELVKQLAENGQIATQYVDMDGNPTMDIHFNPNTSMMAIEGITSPDGRVLGKMGHSERIGQNLYQNVPGEKDQKIFESGVAYFK